jgi:hypothetical protein
MATPTMQSTGEEATKQSEDQQPTFDNISDQQTSIPTKGLPSKTPAKGTSQPAQKLSYASKIKQDFGSRQSHTFNTKNWRVVEKAKFSKGVQSSKDSVDPYVSKLVAKAPISSLLLQQIVQQLPPVPQAPPPGRYVKQFKVDPEVLGARTEELKNVAIVLYTPGLIPSRDAIEQWMAELSTDLKVTTTQIRVLGNSTFLVAFDSSAGRQTVLDSTPLMFNSRMVLAQAYEPSLNIAELQLKATAVWVNLICMHPILEAEANRMLAEVGPVLHSSVKTSKSKFQNISGCVLVDLTEDLVHGLELTDDCGGTGIVEVQYKDLPRHCQIFHQRGHLPNTCHRKPASVFFSWDRERSAPAAKTTHSTHSTAPDTKSALSPPVGNSEEFITMRARKG